MKRSNSYSEQEDNYIMNEPSNWKAALLLGRTQEAINQRQNRLRKDGKDVKPRNGLHRESAWAELETDLLFKRVPKELADAYNARQAAANKSRKATTKKTQPQKQEASSAQDNTPSEDVRQRIDEPEVSSFFAHPENETPSENNLQTSVSLSPQMPSSQVAIEPTDLQNQVQQVFLQVGNVSIKLKQGIPFSLNGNIVEIG
jgi:hypothetical protein